MLWIDLPPDAVSRARKFAETYYHLHYKRMQYTKKEDRVDKVYIGKLGEEALALFLETEPSYDVGTDLSVDLTCKHVKIAVKSKRIPQSLVEHDKILMDEWWIHIPWDQYPKIKRNCDYLWGAFVSESIFGVKVGIPGWLRMDHVDELKEFHRAGQQLTPTFTLPPPNSYGIKVSYFKSPYEFPFLKKQSKERGDKVVYSLHEFM